MNATSVSTPEPLTQATEQRFTPPSWLSALSPFILLLLYAALGIHLRLGLGHWPTSISEDYHAPAFEVHRNVLNLFILFTIFCAGPLWLLCLIIRPLRPAWPRTIIKQLLTCAVGCLLIVGVIRFNLDPTPFTAWFFD